MFTVRKLSAEILTQISKLTGQLFDPPRALTRDENSQLIDYARSQSRIIPAELAVKFFEYLNFKPSKSLADVDTLTGYKTDDPRNFLQQLIADNEGEELGIDYIQHLQKTYTKPIQFNAGGTPLRIITRNNIAQFKPTGQIANDAPGSNIIATINSFPLFIRNMNRRAIYKKAYLCLDSRYATFLDNNTKLRWDYIEGLTEAGNCFNATNKIRDIVEARLYSVVVRKFTSAMARSSVFIEEFSAQSFIAPNGRRFHFIGRLNDLNNPFPFDNRNAQVTIRSLATELFDNKYELLAGYRFNEGIYRFNQPITSLNSLTLSFGDPFSVLTIQKDRFTNVTLDLDFSFLDSFGNLSGRIIVTFPEPHYYNFTPAGVGLYTDTSVSMYSVFISGFTTTDPVADAAFITELNNTEYTMARWQSATELYIYPYVINPPGTRNYIIYRAADALLGLPLVGVPSTCTIIFTGERIIANLELTYLDSSLE